MPLPPTTLIVPCKDEALRLDVAAFRAFVDHHEALRLLFVDDGSRDDTPAILAELARHPRVLVHTLPHNQGKAEAVRQGVLAAPEDCEVIAWWDADLATPLAGLVPLLRVLEERPSVDLVLGARVRMLGHPIARGVVRHYLGRVAATMASWVLELPVHDTQCGAKAGRREPVLRLFREPFMTTWTFDVELIARVLAAHPELGRDDVHDVLVEHPVISWTAVPGSKVGWLDFLRAPLDLLRIGRAYGLWPWRRNDGHHGRRSR